MKKPNPLNYQYLRRTLDPSQLNFKSTADLEIQTKFIGQERALEAVSFGIGIKNQGYNMYAMGPSGVGKRALIRRYLEAEKRKHLTPSDWCYIHNFDSPEKPIALQLPPGKGSSLQKDMKHLIEIISASTLSIFESDQYHAALQKIHHAFNRQRESISKKTKNDKVPFLYKQRFKKERILQLKLAASVVKPLISKLKNKYKKFPQVVKYLISVQQDIINHVTDFIKRDEDTNVLTFSMENPLLIKYQVNLLVDNSKTKGSPIIFEEDPTYTNLISRVEHTTQFGTLVTNFTLIKPGALHKANGGYLIIEARKFKKEPRAWEGLKRALYSRDITIDPVQYLSGSVRPISLEPMPIPLDIKVILLGDRHTYYYLSNNDPDFGELFKVAVDFDEQIERNKSNIDKYARLIGTIAKSEKLRPFQAGAVAAIIDHSTRLAEDVDKLSTHIRSIIDLIVEADYWASIDKKKKVETKHVAQAIDAHTHRLDRTRQMYYEEINRNFILINTTDKLIGQINCLSVIKAGTFSYGHPTRLTANVYAGKGKIIDIQREIDMAGPIHTKGGLIISNYIAGRYCPDQQFSLSASISFEQIYGMMEGDSASVAELCVLLSAISGVPLKQYLALTGSIDQYGVIQAVGCINEKIEGFYDVCKTKGLTGKQGVLIPAINVKNLMLRKDVVEAAKNKKFNIYAVNTIDQAISILTGISAGERDKNGNFPENTINYKVETRLKEFTKNRKKV